MNMIQFLRNTLLLIVVYISKMLVMKTKKNNIVCLSLSHDNNNDYMKFLIFEGGSLTSLVLINRMFIVYLVNESNRLDIYGWSWSKRPHYDNDNEHLVTSNRKVCPPSYRLFV